MSYGYKTKKPGNVSKLVMEVKLLVNELKINCIVNLKREKRSYGFSFFFEY